MVGHHFSKSSDISRCRLAGTVRLSVEGNVRPSVSSETPLSQWFTREVAPHRPKIRRYLLGKFCRQIDVDDVLQETFLRLWRSASIRPVRQPRAMLYVIARNTALNHLRRRSRNLVVDVTADCATSVADDAPGVPEQLHRKHRLEQLDRALASLPPRAREVIKMRRIEGLRCRQIAELLGISERTVEAHIANALRLCSEYAAAQPN